MRQKPARLFPVLRGPACPHELRTRTTTTCYVGVSWCVDRSYGSSPPPRTQSSVVTVVTANKGPPPPPPPPPLVAHQPAVLVHPSRRLQVLPPLSHAHTHARASDNSLRRLSLFLIRYVCVITSTWSYYELSPCFVWSTPQPKTSLSHVMLCSLIHERGLPAVSGKCRAYSQWCAEDDDRRPTVVNFFPPPQTRQAGLVHGKIPVHRGEPFLTVATWIGSYAESRQYS